MSPAAPFSPFQLLLDADPVVKGVMALLVLASILSWALALEGARRQAWLRRALRRAAAKGFSAQPALGEPVLAAARESADCAIAGETGGERRARLERAMREAAGRLIGATDAGTSILATIAAVAPFVGLFGTVWGVMNSFVAIAGANDTSLATVAPGIAEALFTTALGLFAAIPAVIAYNRLGAGLSGLARQVDALLRRESERFAAALAPPSWQAEPILDAARFRAAAE